MMFEGRDDLVWRLHREGLSNNAIAWRVGLSPPWVGKTLRRLAALVAEFGEPEQRPPLTGA
ncbi:hypothetical protein AWB91_09065 [Mycobacterium paraense]|uniref:Uncharacterized protein n=1 Tax=Mycobacterium paraense TaxID=767916 RepID=A0ABX3VSF1_9MYCO|nr:hypothetical protein AWB91_09065 [Mycobacterium paraense]ORW34673.1 hypothetical protein AWB88_02710 [Mycobacterium paraense]